MDDRISTGITALDEKIGGLHQNEVTLVWSVEYSVVKKVVQRICVNNETKITSQALYDFQLTDLMADLVESKSKVIIMVDADAWIKYPSEMSVGIGDFVALCKEQNVCIVFVLSGVNDIPHGYVEYCDNVLLCYDNPPRVVVTKIHGALSHGNLSFGI